MVDNDTSKSLKTKQKLKSEKLILRISFVGSAMFLILECIISFFTHSQAVLMDCVYDLVDLAMLGPFMILVPKLYRPVTEKWPYGLAQMESLFIIIKCGLLLSLDVGLLIDSILLILSGGHSVNAGAVATFELFVSISCISMFFILRHMNKKFSSPTVKAELYIWKLDAYSTGGVGLAFLIQLFLQRTSIAWITPYIDPFIAAAMAILLAKEPIVMIVDAIRSLLLKGPKKVVIEKIRSLTNETLDNFDFNVTFLNVVKTGRKVWVSIYITQKDDLLSISALKEAHDEIIAKLKPKYENVFVEFIPKL